MPEYVSQQLLVSFNDKRKQKKKTFQDRDELDALVDDLVTIREAYVACCTKLKSKRQTNAGKTKTIFFFFFGR